jgi:hypothetical protein
MNGYSHLTRKKMLQAINQMGSLNTLFNTRILDATNYANQDYMSVNYTLIVVYTMLLVTASHIKKRLMLLPVYGP